MASRSFSRLEVSWVLQSDMWTCASKGGQPPGLRPHCLGGDSVDEFGKYRLGRLKSMSLTYTDPLCSLRELCEA